MSKRDITIGILLTILFALTAGSVFAASYTPKLAADIWPGGDSAPEELIVFNGELIFSADDGTNGRDIHPTGSSDPSDFAIYNGDLYFRATNGTGYDLWVYDGTNPPTPIAAAPSTTYSYPEGMTVYNGNLYFAAEFFSNPTDYGVELLVYDGTTISLAADINSTAATASSTPYSLAVYAGQLFFGANDGVDGIELWSYNGVTASQAADIHPTGDSLPDGLMVHAGKLFFSADDGAGGFELWQYNDGTGTATQAADIFPGATGSYPSNLTEYNGKLYFAARERNDYYELFEYTDGTGTTVRAGVIPPGDEYSYPDWLTVFAGKLYFAAYNWPEGYEVFTFDGTNYAIGADITPDSTSSKPRHFAVWGDVLYLQANDGTTGAELWELSDLSGPTIVRTSLKPLMAEDITEIRVTFDEDVYDPPGSTDVNDVTNPANYLLVSAGFNDTLDTTTCTVAGDDVTYAVNAVTYNSGTFTATLFINGGIPLPFGRYALVVCGAGQNGIMDPLGNRLNDGADERILFEIVDELLPDTGFAPGVQTDLVGKSNLKSYSDLWLEVPSLGVEMDILGVPKTAAGWDVGWLGRNAGWLEGSAFPTWSGNTVITGHVWNADGYPGPFIHVRTMSHGDTIKLHAWGLVYTYEVRITRLIHASQINTAFEHEKIDWLTLLTCESWDPSQGEYRYRRLVRAVLVDVSPE